MAISNVSNGFRPGVCTSTTRPTAPFEGQMIYETDTNRVLVYDSAAWVMPNSQTTNPPGLEFITSKSWTTGSTVSVDNCFTSTYSSYRLVIRNAKHATASVNVVFRLRASGTDKSDNSYYWSRQYIAMGGGSGGYTGESNSGGIQPGIVATTSNAGSGVIDVHDPQKANVTTCSFQGIWPLTTGETGQGTGFLNNTTSYDGFSLVANTGNFTALTVMVYGYRE